MTTSETESLTHPCSSCGEPVRGTRPSKTGKHWCTRSSCVTAKNAFYRSRSRAQSKVTDEQEAAAFVAALANGFTSCSYCGQERALAGWLHPTRDLSAPCAKLGRRGVLLPAGWIAIVWPGIPVM